MPKIPKKKSMKKIYDKKIRVKFSDSSENLLDAKAPSNIGCTSTKRGTSGDTGTISDCITVANVISNINVEGTFLQLDYDGGEGGSNMRPGVSNVTEIPQAGLATLFGNLGKYRDDNERSFVIGPRILSQNIENADSFASVHPNSPIPAFNEELIIEEANAPVIEDIRVVLPEVLMPPPVIPQTISVPFKLYKNIARENILNVPLFEVGSLSSNICQNCKAYFYEAEKTVLGKYNKCCEGKFATWKEIMPTNEWSKYPLQMKNLILRNNKITLDFLKNIRHYNCAFAFTSMGAKVDKNVNNRNLPPVFRIHGQIYHNLSHLDFNQLGLKNFSQLYILDSEEAKFSRIQNCPNFSFNSNILNLIINTLTAVNKYAGSFLTMREVLRNHYHPNVDLHLRFTDDVSVINPPDGLNQRNYIAPIVNEVSIIYQGYDGAPPCHRAICIHPYGSKAIPISGISDLCMPMTYPLIFPYGSYGWKPSLRVSHNITMRKFYRCLLHIRAQNISNRAFNPLILFRKLFQMFLVDQWVNVETNDLNYIRHHQNDLRVSSYSGLIDFINYRAQEQNLRPGFPVILPSSVTGSPRYMREKYADSMIYVTRFGLPTYFITFTCNPMWNEIRSELKFGQTFVDRPDIVNRIFYCKLKNFLKEIIKDQIFGHCIAHLGVIEFQKRGLPHFHGVFFMSNEDIPRTSEEIDQVISARIPDETHDPHLYNIVTKCMMHAPCHVLRNSICMKDGKCSKAFPKKFQNETIINERGYPIYKRPNDGRIFITTVGRQQITLDNKSVVPHNPYLQKRYNAHINVELCVSVKCIKYLYKYIFKGADRCSVEVQNVNNVFTVDEVSSYVDARYVTANEAHWRLMEFDMIFHSHSIERLQVHLPNFQNVYFYPGQEIHAVNRPQHSTLLAWFILNQEDQNARELNYINIPEHYTYSKGRFSLRKKHFNKIGRMFYVSPRDGELFHLRVLLLHVKGATSFEDLRRYQGTIYSSFRETCIARGLFEDDEEWFHTMNEAIVFLMPYQLRELFVCIVCFNVVRVRALFDQFESHMYDDFLHMHDENIDIAKEKLLRKLWVMFQDKGIISMESIGLPPPSTTDFMLESEYIDVAIEAGIAASMENNLNNGQKNIFEFVMGLVYNSSPIESRCVCVSAFAGSGKSYLFNTIVRKMRSLGKKVIACAFTGIASTLLIDGSTLHSRFRLPLNLDAQAKCMISSNSKEYQTLHESDMIIIDECSMVPLFAMQAIDRLLREIEQNLLPFGNKIIILGGDWRQMLPVSMDVNLAPIEISIKNSLALWEHLKKFSLTENMRVNSDEIFYSEWLLKLGNGELPTIRDSLIVIPSQFLIPSNTEIQNSVYGNNIITINENDLDIFNESNIPPSISDLSQKSILCPTNVDTFKINEKVLSLISGEARIYFSADSAETSDGSDYAFLYPIEYLNKATPMGMPPHKLVLKRGAIVMLLRNLNISSGLCNGTRLIVHKLGVRCITCKIVTKGSFMGKTVAIPRIDLISQDNRLPYKLRRRQYPIRLAFAMTINKSQGQSLNTVGIFLPNPCFSHGQLYTAFSRATTPENVFVQVVEIKGAQGDINNDGKIYTRNKLNKEILD